MIYVRGLCYRLSHDGYVMCLQVGRKALDFSIARDGFQGELFNS